MITRRPLLFLVALFILISLDPAAARRPAAPSTSALWGLETAAPSGRIVIKFSEDADLSVTDTGLASRSSDTAARLTALIHKVAPGARLERRFSRPADRIEADRRAAEARLGRSLPDLNRYAQLEDPTSSHDRAALMAVVKALMADPDVQRAFLEPVAVPAALGFDAFTGQTPPASPLEARPGASAQERSDTPDFTGLQDYLESPPLGVGAWDVAATPGADGATVKVVDIEGAWLWSHEDLTLPFTEIGGQIDDLSWRNHGTAVLGEIRGADNGYGVRGIAPACAVGASSIAGQSVADALDNAAAALAPGDVILIELHAPGPNSDGNGQFGYVCMEFWQDNFDAILLATAAGRIVCEAAGNGQQNLDDPVYMGLFDREVRDSGAILCGATNGGDLAPAYFTNYGSRVDLHGWGFYVVTSGYGGLQGEPLAETRWYTPGFSGTSSASPIVVGSVVSLQGMCKAAFGIALDARLARDILVATGTPQTVPEIHIGPRPDLSAAWALASGGIGELAGVVTDAETAQPVAGVRVEVGETGAFTLTAADGSYRFSLLAGEYNLSFASYFYESAAETASITGGLTTTLDVDLLARDTYDVGARVYDEAGEPLADVRATPRNAPLPATASDAGGLFLIEGIPAGETVEVLLDGLPGFGAGLVTLSEAGTAGGRSPFYFSLPGADEDFESDNGGFSAYGDPIWQWGTPAGGGPTGGGFSGLKCWGVGMAGDYGDNQKGWLESPAYDFTGWTSLYLSFHHWRETEAGFDGANVQVFVAGDWVVLEPLTGYTDILLGGLAYQPGWAGTSGGWEGVVFDLSPYIGPGLRFRLEFGSDGGVTGAGFWIDDIALYESLGATGVEGGAAPARARIAAYPNPFNPSTTLAWSSDSPVEEIAVYDAGGRKLRTLLSGPAAAGAGTLVWDGRDEAGRGAASGIYLVRLKTARETIARRIVLAK